MDSNKPACNPIAKRLSSNRQEIDYSEYDTSGLFGGQQPKGCKKMPPDGLGIRGIHVEQMWLVVGPTLASVLTKKESVLHGAICISILFFSSFDPCLYRHGSEQTHRLETGAVERFYFYHFDWFIEETKAIFYQTKKKQKNTL